MKNLIQSFILLVLLFSIPSGNVNGAQSIQVTPEPNTPEAEQDIYLPLVSGKQPNYSISGSVVDGSNNPVSGAAITDQYGRTAISDDQGNYAIQGLTPGQYALAPALQGYLFSPSLASIRLPNESPHLDFKAYTACTDEIKNGGFEKNTDDWEFPATPYSAGYSSERSHSGDRSARTGILNSADNIYSYSSARQPIYIPSNAGSATLRLWLYPISNEGTSAPLPEAPTGPTFGDQVLSSDVQYVLILDQWDNLIQKLLWIRNYDRYRKFYEFSLNAYRGDTIQIQVGTYNDGWDGVTAMFVDDVSVEVCPHADLTPTPTPTIPPGGCDDLIDNSGFEKTRSWDIPITVYPASYSTDRAHSGSRSMRTGIVSAYDNQYSYSDAGQWVTIPGNATSAKLYLWEYSSSSEYAMLALPERPDGKHISEMNLSSDSQYVLVLNPYGYILETLLLQRSNAKSWVSHEFNLKKYAGQTIKIQFGTYNDGWNGITSMYVDDVTLEVCTSTPPTATPTPKPGVTPTPTSTPSICSERVENGGFEWSEDWIIPITEFSAGYSNERYHHGSRSMRNGIVYQSHNRYSYSDAAQIISIPASYDDAELRMWLYPMSSEPAEMALPGIPQGKVFGTATLSSDVQYILILDIYGNWIDTLLWQRSNAQSWKEVTFDLDRYIGWSIRLQFGTYNDGWSGVTAMYVDDVSLQVCP
jgi:hypothetical protein